MIFASNVVSLLAALPLFWGASSSATATAVDVDAGAEASKKSKVVSASC